MERGEFPKTFQYAPLTTPTEVRLLQVISPGNEGRTETPTYIVVHTDLLSDVDSQLEFESVSYTWGSPDRVSSLILDHGSGSVGLTQNLTLALPHLARHSATRYLWIDQICINQNDPAEKSHQIGMMSRIYKTAKRVIVWLGPEDENSGLCTHWLGAVAEMIKGMPNSDRMTPDTETFTPDIRSLVVRSTFVSPDTDPIYALAIRNFWSRQ